MIRLSIENGYLVFDVSDGCVAARHENQLAFWGFKFDPVTRRFLSPAETSADFVAKVLSYLSRSQIPDVLRKWKNGERSGMPDQRHKQRPRGRI